MELLPEVDNELEPKQALKEVAVKVIKGIRPWHIVLALAIAVCIWIYTSISDNVEARVRLEYDEKIVSLEEQIREIKDYYEGELAKQKESYEKKLTNAEEKHAKEISKKDEIIAAKDKEIGELKIRLQVNFDEIETEIKTVGKLTTIDYCYTYAGTHEDVDDFFGVELPWTKNSFTAQWDGVVALGVDLSKVKIAVEESSKVITVFMPKAEIFYHDVDENSFVVVDERNNMLNPISVVDIKQFDALYEERIYEKVAEQRMLEDAYENAKLMIENIINATPNVAGQYTITFKQDT